MTFHYRRNDSIEAVIDITFQSWTENFPDMFYKSMNACSYELGSNGSEPTLTLTVLSQHDDSGHSKLDTTFSVIFNYHSRSYFWPNLDFTGDFPEFNYSLLSFRSCPP